MDSIKNILQICKAKKIILPLVALLGITCYVSFGMQNGFSLDIVPLREVVFRNPKIIQPPNNKVFEASLHLSPQDLIDSIEVNMPNLPSKYWYEQRKNAKSRKKPCAKYPSIFDLHYSSLLWQTLITKQGTFNLYSAYYDNRTLIASNPVIRILGAIDRVKYISNTTCQLWFEGIEEPIFSVVEEYRSMWLPSWGNFANGRSHGHLITCKIPKNHQHLVPISVSLVENPCDAAKTNLKVINNRPVNGKKEDFAVCVKGLDLLNDFSVRLIEWLELLFLLGANKVFFYEFTVHPNITKVLKYYESQGKIEVSKLTLPGYQPNSPKLRHMYIGNSVLDQYKNEILTYNDCLYKNMYRYKYVSNVDVDEVILPNNATDWKMLMNIVQSKSQQNASSFAPAHFYYFDGKDEKHTRTPGIPDYMHMLQHTVVRARIATPPTQNKAFHDPERVLTSHNHYPLTCLDGNCIRYYIDREDAQLMHYRGYCVDIYKHECDKKYKTNTVVDSTILRYKDSLIDRVTHVLKDLRFI